MVSGDDACSASCSGGKGKEGQGKRVGTVAGNANTGMTEYRLEAQWGDTVMDTMSIGIVGIAGTPAHTMSIGMVDIG